MANILPQLDSSTQHINDKGKPTKDFTNWLKSVSDFVSKTAQAFTSLVIGSPTGGNKGDGSINSQTIYLNGTALGTASTKNVGVANGVPSLDSSNRIIGDGSQLTGLPGRIIAGTSLVLDPFAINSTTTQAHGLGTVPVFFSATLQCKTTELNYSVGDIVLLYPNFATDYTIVIDATNTSLITNSVTVPQIENKTTRAHTGITPANWKITITPYKLS